MGKTVVDIWLDRGMKLIGIIGFFAASLMAINGSMFLPTRVDANQVEIQKLKDWEQKTDNRLTSMEQDIKYLVKGVDEIKGAVRDGR